MYFRTPDTNAGIPKLYYILMSKGIDLNTLLEEGDDHVRTIKVDPLDYEELEVYPAAAI